MSQLRGFLLPTALILALVPTAWAGDDDKKAADKKGDEQTIRGVVSEVTLLGETDIDYKTKKAITAEATFLTIIGHPWNPEEKMRKEGAQASTDKDKDRDVKRTAYDSSKSGERSKHRMNVYVVAITPKTKVCECKESGKEGSAAKEEACSLDRLEVGDRVEICYEPKMTQGSEEKGEQAKGEEMKPEKHGRHRVYFGVAKDVKIMEEPMEANSSESNKK